MTIIIVFSMILITAISILVFVDSYYYEGIYGVAVFVTIFSSIILAGLLIEKDITVKWVEQPVSIVRTPRMVIVDDGEKIWKFTSYEDVVNINDSTKFLFEHTTNVFGWEQIEDIEYTNE